MTVPALLDQGPDPAALGWPTGLPLELALAQSPVREICEAHGISRNTYLALRQDERFRAAVASAMELLSKEGMSFKIKARAQAEALLTTSWGLIHASLDDVPAHVKADLIKTTIRVAGLDASLDQRAQAQAVSQQTALQINIHLE
jgi:hypothetical protein